MITLTVMQRILNKAVLIVAAIALCSCGDVANFAKYQILYLTSKERLVAIVENKDDFIGKGVIYVQQFREAFPNNTFVVAGFVDGDPYNRDLQYVGYFFGRYIIYMDLEITISESGELKVLNFTDPIFYISEVVSIGREPDGRYRLRHGDSYRFNHTKWKVLIENGLDFNAINIMLNQDNSIEGFEDYVNNTLAGRERK